MKTVDLNSDLGEGYGAYMMGNDSALLQIVSSANVACGFHAGDPEIMAETFTLARQNGVVTGAHPGFPDLWGFGRRPIPYTNPQIERLVAYQIGAAQALAHYAGHAIHYVKTHGALNNMAIADQSIAEAICRAMKAVDSTLILLAPALSKQYIAGLEAGLQTRSEIFADRAYLADARLMPRTEPGAVLDDVQQIVERTLRMVRESAIETITGEMLPTPVDSICVHGDSPGALEIARAVRHGLEADGILVRGFL